VKKTPVPHLSSRGDPYSKGEGERLEEHAFSVIHETPKGNNLTRKKTPIVSEGAAPRKGEISQEGDDRALRGASNGERAVFHRKGKKNGGLRREREAVLSEIYQKAPILQGEGNRDEEEEEKKRENTTRKKRLDLLGYAAYNRARSKKSPRKGPS